MTHVSEADQAFLLEIRKAVRQLTAKVVHEFEARSCCQVLDIAPQDHEGVAPFLRNGAVLTTFDINPSSGADVTGDLCNDDGQLHSDFFDVVVCTEVLEHVANPFDAMQHIGRILKPGGLLLASSPFNFRIHGPLPDNWRFSEHGWRQLLKGFTSVSVQALETPARPLMPIHYSIVARL